MRPNAGTHNLSWCSQSLKFNWGRIHNIEDQIPQVSRLARVFSSHSKDCVGHGSLWNLQWTMGRCSYWVVNMLAFKKRKNLFFELHNTKVCKANLALLIIRGTYLLLLTASACNVLTNMIWHFSPALYKFNILHNFTDHVIKIDLIERCKIYS